jgi:hypothetical protein
MVPTASVRLPVPRDLLAATAPFRLAAPLAAALDQVDGDELRDLVRTNRFGDLWALWDADGDPAELWAYADEAEYYLERLPALADVEAARDVVRADIETEPSIEARCDLVCTMLDGWNVTATTTYIDALAWKLGHSPRRQTEKYERTRPWFPLAAIAATVDELLTTAKPQRGRPVDIADVLDIAGRHSSELIRLNRALETLCGVIPLLGRITDAVTNIPKPPPRRRPPVDDDYDVPF